MNKTVLLVILLFASLMSQAQVKKIAAAYDSTRLSKQRQQVLVKQCNSVVKEKKNILVLSTDVANDREQEVLFIGKMQKKEIYRVDLSTVVSKYIGETEKNLSRLFEKAVANNVILFFDEADALFGKKDEAEKTTQYIQRLARDKNVLSVFWCKGNCLKWLKG